MLLISNKNAQVEPFYLYLNKMTISDSSTQKHVNQQCTCCQCQWSPYWENIEVYVTQKLVRFNGCKLFGLRIVQYQWYSWFFGFFTCIVITFFNECWAVATVASVDPRMPLVWTWSPHPAYLAPLRKYILNFLILIWMKMTVAGRGLRMPCRCVRRLCTAPRATPRHNDTH